MLWSRVYPDGWAARPYYRQFVCRGPDRSPASRGGSGIARVWQSDRISTDCDGRTVLDLGSGGGIDVLLSARRVGPTGKVYGLDMTDEMLELARANQAQSRCHQC